MTMVESVRLTVVPEVATVVPGDRLPLSLTVHNASNATMRARVGVIGLPRAWFDLDMTDLALTPAATVRIAMAIHAPASGGPLGRFPFLIQVSSLDGATILASHRVDLTVGADGAGESVAAAAGRGPADHDAPRAAARRARPRWLAPALLLVALAIVALLMLRFAPARHGPAAPVTGPARRATAPATRAIGTPHPQGRVHGITVRRGGHRAATARYCRMVRGQYLRPHAAVSPASSILVPKGARVRLVVSHPDHGWLRATWHGHVGYIGANNCRSS